MHMNHNKKISLTQQKVQSIAKVGIERQADVTNPEKRWNTILICNYNNHRNDIQNSHSSMMVVHSVRRQHRWIDAISTGNQCSYIFGKNEKGNVQMAIESLNYICCCCHCVCLCSFPAANWIRSSIALFDVPINCSSRKGIELSAHLMVVNVDNIVCCTHRRSYKFRSIERHWWRWWWSERRMYILLTHSREWKLFTVEIKLC